MHKPTEQKVNTWLSLLFVAVLALGAGFYVSTFAQSVNEDIDDLSLGKKYTGAVEALAE